MRLRTELYPNRIAGMTFGYDDESLKHDAYAAHALVMAINENVADWLSCPEDDPVKVSSWLLKRAGELMREWGYGED